MTYSGIIHNLLVDRKLIDDTLILELSDMDKNISAKCVHCRRLASVFINNNVPMCYYHAQELVNKETLAV
jgi:hypothetical protein